MTIALQNIIPVIGARVEGFSNHQTIDSISIDSRSLHNRANTLFFALSGVNNDAHDYISELYDEGVRNFVVSHIPQQYDDATFLVVSSPLLALQQLAAWYRKRFSFPVIGITGSNGKTIIKEWLNFLLGPDFTILRSPKSYNSQVGVPLSILAINEYHNLGIFEAGISTTNEMQKLEAIIQPTIGILTNIGSAHDEGFSSSAQKVSEKIKLFKNSEVVICEKVPEIFSALTAELHTFSWSTSDHSADVFITVESQIDKTILNVTFSNETFDVTIPFQDVASIQNALNCLALMLYLKYSPAIISTRMQLLFPVEMRLIVKNGINNSTIIDDSYSSDFQSLKIALDFLESQKQYRRKTLILSDIFQSGLPVEELYSRVAHLVIANKVTRVIGIGETISKYREKFENFIAFPDTKTFIEKFDKLEIGNESILVKGARQFRFEEIVSLLEEKNHETVLEINLNAISYNLSYFKAKLNPSTKLMVMVKAFGYGYGGFEIAKLLEYHNVDYLGVAFADEGIALRAAGIQTPIMVLNPENSSFSSIIQFNLEPEIYSFKGLLAFIKIANDRKLSNFPIHLKIDTGMHRLGFQAADIAQLITILKQTNTVLVKSILSHLATSDETQNDFARKQITLFEKISSCIIAELKINPIRHILNTSGISNFGDAQFDMVRLGIGLYGVSNDSNEQRKLQTVGTLKSIISQLRTIEAGESVGYGQRFVAEKPTTIATIPIGYADGIPRHWGNQTGYVTINNQKAKIVGSICMDMLMLDVTSIKCREGDSVTVFGESPTVMEIATSLDTIPYEILTGISQRVKRIFYRE